MHIYSTQIQDLNLETYQKKIYSYKEFELKVIGFE